MVNERIFQSNLVKRIKALFPECVVFKSDANLVQGYPDLVLHFPHGRYACLEVKKSMNASHRPNQDYYVDKINRDGGFAAFIYPENEETIITQLIDYVNN